MEIKPTYVTFEQAKGFKEKGFDIKVNSLFSEDGFAIRENQDVKNYNSLLNEGFSRPEQWMLVEYLRVKHGIWISVKTLFDHEIYGKQDKWGFDITNLENASYFENIMEYNSPQEAYSAAFDYVLNNII